MKNKIIDKSSSNKERIIKYMEEIRVLFGYLAYYL